MSENISIINQNSDVSLTEVTENISISDNVSEINISNPEVRIDLIENIENISILNSKEILNISINDILILPSNPGQSTTNLQKIFDFINENEIIVGLSNPTDLPSSSTWKIYKIFRNYNTGPLCRFANGTESFDKVWNDRISYDFL